MNAKSKVGFLFFIVFFLIIGVSSVEAADPVVVELHYQNGVKFYKRGLYDRAIAEFEKTLSLDPSHSEARDYLEKTKVTKNAQTRVEAKKSRSANLESLYEEGKKRYAKRDYEGAIEIFNDILAIKPIDDFASFYKERSEIMISRKLGREKKIENKKRIQEEKKENREKAKQAALLKKEQKKQMLEDRRAIALERKQLRDNKLKATQALKEVSVEKAVYENEIKATVESAGLQGPEKKPVADKELLKQQRKAEKEARARLRKEEKEKIRQEKIEARDKARQERLEAKEKIRQDRLEAKEKKRQEKLAAKQEALEKKKDSVKIEQVIATSDTVQNKELFLKGVEEYGAKKYEAAIESLTSLIEAEKSGKKIYTNSAKRMLDKAKRRLEETKKV